MRQSHRVRKRSALPGFEDVEGRDKLFQKPTETPHRRNRSGISWSIRDRGVASMDRMKHPEIVGKGGKAAHQKGTAH